VIYNKDKEAYHSITERLPHKDRKFLDSSIQNNQLLDGLDDGFFLGVEMILFHQATACLLKTYRKFNLRSWQTRSCQ